MTGGTPFSIDRKIPLATIIAVAAQTLIIVWMASQLVSRVDAIERQAAEVATSTKDLEVIRYRLDALDRATGRIEAKLDKASGS